jgi:apolipoprotein N-acyltransferase
MNPYAPPSCEVGTQPNRRWPARVVLTLALFPLFWTTQLVPVTFRDPLANRTFYSSAFFFAMLALGMSAWAGVRLRRIGQVVAMVVACLSLLGMYGALRRLVGLPW